MTLNFSDALKIGDVRTLRAIPRATCTSCAGGRFAHRLGNGLAGYIAPLDQPLVFDGRNACGVEDRGSLSVAPGGSESFRGCFRQAKTTALVRLRLVKMFGRSPCLMTTREAHLRVVACIQGSARHRMDPPTWTFAALPNHRVTRWLAPFLELGLGGLLTVWRRASPAHRTAFGHLSYGKG